MQIGEDNKSIIKEPKLMSLFMWAVWHHLNFIVCGWLLLGLICTRSKKINVFTTQELDMENHVYVQVYQLISSISKQNW